MTTTPTCTAQDVDTDDGCDEEYAEAQAADHLLDLDPWASHPAYDSDYYEDN